MVSANLLGSTLIDPCEQVWVWGSSMQSWIVIITSLETENGRSGLSEGGKEADHRANWCQGQLHRLRTGGTSYRPEIPVNSTM